MTAPAPPLSEGLDPPLNTKYEINRAYDSLRKKISSGPKGRKVQARKLFPQTIRLVLASSASTFYNIGYL